MKRIHIDFAPRSVQRAILRTPHFGWLALVIALTLWAGIAIKAGTLFHQKDIAEAELKNVQSRVRARLAEQTARAQAIKKITISDAQAAAVNSAIAQLNLPWRDLFHAIENATPASVALISIEPDAKKHLIKAVAETKNGNAMIAYIEQLKKETFFNHVALTKHEVNEQDPNRPIRFQFEAQWNEAAQ